MNSCAWAAFAASMTSSRVASNDPYAMFSPTVPAKRNVSWLTYPTDVRKLLTETSRTSCPSTRIVALVHVVESQEEFQYRGLSRTGRSDEREGFAAADLEVHVLDDGLLVVAEGDVLVLDDGVRNREVGRVIVGIEPARFVHQAERRAPRTRQPAGTC